MQQIIGFDSYKAKNIHAFTDRIAATPGIFYKSIKHGIKANFSKWHPWNCWPGLGALVSYSPLTTKPPWLLASTSPSRGELLYWQCTSHTHLVKPSNVVLSEDTAQSLVNATCRPSEAVLAAGPAPCRFGCTHQRGRKHQEKHENPDSFHGDKRPKMSTRWAYQNGSIKRKVDQVDGYGNDTLLGCDKLFVMLAITRVAFPVQRVPSPLPEPWIDLSLFSSKLIKQRVIKLVDWQLLIHHID